MPAPQLTCPHGHSLTSEEARAIAEAYRNTRRGKVGQPRKSATCPHCGALTNKRELDRRTRSGDHKPTCQLYSAD